MKLSHFPTRILESFTVQGSKSFPHLHFLFPLFSFPHTCFLPPLLSSCGPPPAHHAPPRRTLAWSRRLAACTQHHRPSYQRCAARPRLLWRSSPSHDLARGCRDAPTRPWPQPSVCAAWPMIPPSRLANPNPPPPSGWPTTVGPPTMDRGDSNPHSRKPQNPNPNPNLTGVGRRSWRR